MSLPQNMNQFATLVDIIARLRAPDGCPWDRQQTHASLRPYLLEESYEVLQALDDGSPEKRCEELGDLLFSLVNVARWLGVDAESALRGACDRFVHRYTSMEKDAHDRGLDLAAMTLAEQDALWDKAKRRS